MWFLKNRNRDIAWRVFFAVNERRLNSVVAFCYVRRVLTDTVSGPLSESPRLQTQIRANWTCSRITGKVPPFRPPCMAACGELLGLAAPAVEVVLRRLPENSGLQIIY